MSVMTPAMSPLTGAQYEIAAGDYHAIATELGAGLRELRDISDDRDSQNAGDVVFAAQRLLQLVRHEHAAGIARAELTPQTAGARGAFAPGGACASTDPSFHSNGRSNFQPQARSAGRTACLAVSTRLFGWRRGRRTPTRGRMAILILEWWQ